ncbi:MAG: helix-turn-helix transcriptional regulator [Lachnospiraceae bacterium]|nr:helix-turn-helix transcriptional regulator [Lachnospiraceae bacterium]
MENRIRELRKSKGMNQDTLASFVGVSQQTISKIERDMNSMSIDILVQIAKHFNVTTDYLLGISDEKRNLHLENRMSRRLEENYNLVVEYEDLDDYNRKVVVRMVEVLKSLQEVKKVKKSSENK